MVYCIGSFRKIRFNRNILYCKSLLLQYKKLNCLYLIGTFCIVNFMMFFCFLISKDYLIGTFCIVNCERDN